MNTENIEEIVEEAVEKLSALDNVTSVIIVAVLAVLAIYILTKPFRMLLKLGINTVLGFVSLIAVNYVGAFIGVTVGVNWINAIIVAISGVPGVCVLFALRWLALV